jgi:hypothetical protein
MESVTSGAPQCGHAAARFETFSPQSGQAVRFAVLSLSPHPAAINNINSSSPSFVFIKAIPW